MFTFLYELTVYDQEHRTQIFRSALAKVFFTTLALYFIAIIFSHWIQQIVEFSQKNYWDFMNYKDRLRTVMEEIQDMREIAHLSEREI